jgi:hypothetical protein
MFIPKKTKQCFWVATHFGSLYWCPDSKCVFYCLSAAINMGFCVRRNKLLRLQVTKFLQTWEITVSLSYPFQLIRKSIINSACLVLTNLELIRTFLQNLSLEKNHSRLLPSLPPPIISATLLQVLRVKFKREIWIVNSLPRQLFVSYIVQPWIHNSKSI